MPTYVFYDAATGEIVHVHAEYYMGSDQTVDVDESRLMEELGELLPREARLGVLAVEEEPRPVRGYRHVVDPSTAELSLVERPAQGQERSQ